MTICCRPPLWPCPLLMGWSLEQIQEQLPAHILRTESLISSLKFTTEYSAADLGLLLILRRLLISSITICNCLGRHLTCGWDLIWALCRRVQEETVPTVENAANLFHKLVYENKNGLMAGIIIGGTLFLPIIITLGSSIYRLGSYSWPWCLCNQPWRLSSQETLLDWRIWVFIYLWIL